MRCGVVREETEKKKCLERGDFRAAECVLLNNIYHGKLLNCMLGPHCC